MKYIKTIIIWVLLGFIFSCNTENNADKILKISWTGTDTLNQIISINDSTIKIYKKEIEHNNGEFVTRNGNFAYKITDSVFFKISSITNNKILVKGDSSLLDTISYEIKIIKKKPYLLLLFEETNNYKFNFYLREIYSLSTNDSINFIETNNYKTDFNIDGFRIGDTIHTDSLSCIPYMIMASGYTKLLKNKNLFFDINNKNRKINSIIKVFYNGELDNILKNITEETGIKPKKINGNYLFIKNGLNLHVLYSDWTGNQFFYEQPPSQLKQKSVLCLSYRNIIKEEIKTIKMGYTESYSQRYSWLMGGVLMDKAVYSNKPVELLKNYNLLIKNNKDCYELYLLRGEIKSKMGNRTGAITDIKRCVEINPYHYLANLYLVILYRQQDEYDEVFKYANKVIELNPDETYAYRILAEYYMRINQNEKACECLNKAFDNGDIEVLEYIKRDCN